MAFPPAPLPVNYTNLTPQQDDHPAAHNDTNAAVNDIVDAVQQNQAAILNATAQFGSVTGGGAAATGGTGFTGWVTIPATNFTVPVAATVAIIVCSMTGIQSTVNDCIYNLRLRIGANDASPPVQAHAVGSTADRFGVTMIAQASASGLSGSASVSVLANRVSSVGAFVLDSVSDTSAMVTFA